MNSAASQETRAMDSGKPASQASPEVFEEVTVTVDSGGGSVATHHTKTVMIKRKRARSRKRDPPPAQKQLSPVSVSPPAENRSMKRIRGRPKGSGKLQILATLGGCFAATTGRNFCPHALTVKAGEDLASKIKSFVALPQRAVCVLSACGMVSRVQINKPDSSNPMQPFEGSFEILSLSGSYMYHKKDNRINAVGNFSISLAKPNGQVFGGLVGGPVIAESPIQLVVATFKQNAILKFLESTNLLTELPAVASSTGDSQMIKAPKHIATMRDGKKSCNTQTTARHN